MDVTVRSRAAPLKWSSEKPSPDRTDANAEPGRSAAPKSAGPYRIGIIPNERWFMALLSA
jgi:hypothetical protein